MCLVTASLFLSFCCFVFEKFEKITTLQFLLTLQWHDFIECFGYFDLLGHWCVSLSFMCEPRCWIDRVIKILSVKTTSLIFFCGCLLNSSLSSVSTSFFFHPFIWLLWGSAGHILWPIDSVKPQGLTDCPSTKSPNIHEFYYYTLIHARELSRVQRWRSCDVFTEYWSLCCKPNARLNKSNPYLQCLCWALPSVA